MSLIRMLLGLLSMFALMATRFNVMAEPRPTTTRRRTGTRGFDPNHHLGSNGSNVTNAATQAPTTPTKTNQPTTPDTTPVDDTDPDRARQVLAQNNFCCGQLDQIQPFDRRMLALYGGNGKPTSDNDMRIRWNAVSGTYNQLYDRHGLTIYSDDQLRDLDRLMKENYGPSA